MKRNPIYLLTVILMLVLNLASHAQETTQTDSLRKDALNVYMEADDFIRQEIPFINYVRDIQDADLYIISTSQQTGSGGSEYTYYLTGQNQFASMGDTLKFSSSSDMTREEIREGKVKVLKMGLMRYIMKTPLAEHISIGFTQPISEVVSEDKWNSWVFRSNINGFMNGQKSNQSYDVFGGISANHTTADWKLDFGLDFSKGENKFDLGEDEEGNPLEYISTNTDKSFNAMVVKSLNDHWSIGGRTSVSASTYRNLDFQAGIFPGIEYDIFPYSESTRRQIRILYTIGYSYSQYADTTIYDKIEEGLFSHRLSVGVGVVQKWGSIDLSAGYSNYLHDWKYNNIYLNGSINIRVFKGLSFSIGGGGSIIHDQLGLVKGGATDEEILLRRRELETQYSYFTHFGISYTFGSIYNNVVNPRFGNGGGGRTIIIN